MSKLEADYKRDIVKEVKAAGGYAHRIEDQFSVGFPDMVIIVPGCIRPFFAEFKRFDGGVFKPSPRQYVEMMRIDQAGGLSVLIGIKNGLYYFNSPAMSATDATWYGQKEESFVQAILCWAGREGKLRT